MPIAARWLDSLKALSLVHGKHLVYEGRRFSRPFSAWPVGRDKPSTSLHGPSFRDWANILDTRSVQVQNKVSRPILLSSNEMMNKTMT